MEVVLGKASSLPGPALPVQAAQDSVLAPPATDGPPQGPKLQGMGKIKGLWGVVHHCYW